MERIRVFLLSWLMWATTHWRWIMLIDVNCWISLSYEFYLKPACTQLETPDAPCIYYVMSTHLPQGFTWNVGEIFNCHRFVAVGYHELCIGHKLQYFPCYGGFAWTHHLSRPALFEEERLFNSGMLDFFHPSWRSVWNGEHVDHSPPLHLP